MKRFKLLALALLLLGFSLQPCFATGWNVTIDWQTAIQGNVSNKFFTVVPDGLGTNGNYVTTIDSLAGLGPTDVNGQFIVSNMVSGGYTATLKALNTPSSVHFVVPAGSGNTNWINLINPGISGNAAFNAYSQAQSDARYFQSAGTNGGSANYGTAFITNAVTDTNHIYITSTGLNESGRYDLMNAVGGAAVYTNVNAITRIDFNDDVYQAIWVLEETTNDPDFLHYSETTPVDVSQSGWTPNASLGFIQYASWGTNFVRGAAFTYPAVAPVAFSPPLFTGSNNVYVSPLHGDDSKPTGLFSYPYSTVFGAKTSPLLAAGGFINCEPGVDPETNNIVLPPNITLNAYNTVFTGYGCVGLPFPIGPFGFTASSGCVINGAQIVNANISFNTPDNGTSATNVYWTDMFIQGVEDGLYYQGGTGCYIVSSFIRCRFNNSMGYDSLRMGMNTTNSVVSLINCQSDSIRTPPYYGFADGGTHAINFEGFGGRLIIDGGILRMFGATNTSGSAHNACLDITGLLPGSSVELRNNPVFVFNAIGGASAVPIAGTAADLAMVTGSYIAVTNTDWYGPINTAITNVALTANVATITTSAPHELQTGMNVLIQGLTTTALNTASVAITVTGARTLTFALTHANISSTGDSGNLSPIIGPDRSVGYLVTMDQSTNAVTATGYTNNTPRSQEVDMTVASATYKVFNAAGNAVFTNSTYSGSTGFVSHTLAPKAAITAASGLSGSAHTVQ